MAGVLIHLNIHIDLEESEVETHRNQSYDAHLQYNLST